jgi:hypothetical protein
MLNKVYFFIIIKDHAINFVVYVKIIHIIKIQNILKILRLVEE